jgi:hypothetical protein
MTKNEAIDDLTIVQQLKDFGVKPLKNQPTQYPPELVENIRAFVRDQKLNKNDDIFALMSEKTEPCLGASYMFTAVHDCEDIWKVCIAGMPEFTMLVKPPTNNEELMKVVTEVEKAVYKNHRYYFENDLPVKSLPSFAAKQAIDFMLDPEYVLKIRLHNLKVLGGANHLVEH